VLSPTPPRFRRRRPRRWRPWHPWRISTPISTSGRAA
jgi:hypothetical protein